MASSQEQDLKVEVWDFIKDDTTYDSRYFKYRWFVIDGESPRRNKRNRPNNYRDSGFSRTMWSAKLAARLAIRSLKEKERREDSTAPRYSSEGRHLEPDVSELDEVDAILRGEPSLNRRRLQLTRRDIFIAIVSIMIYSIVLFTFTLGS